jgi:hemolysin III
MSLLIRTLHALTPEERANALTHGVGVLLSLAGLAFLAARAGPDADGRATVAIGVYGVSLLCVYVASTMCHVATGAPSARLRRLALTLDYACIYLMIAGTYTPFLVTAVGGPAGATLLGIVWALGLAGIVGEARGARRSERMACAVYLALGWLGLLVVRPLAASVGLAGLGLLVGGGLCYSLGVIFFLLEGVAYAHALWHLCVLGGSVLHYASVLRLPTH